MTMANSGSGYSETLVKWQVDDIDVEGTLLTPQADNNGCGIVMVAGSGPTDRDWCSPILPGKNGSGKLVAEKLATVGYNVLRYDKRASGSHRMENATKLAGKISMESHREELAGAVDYLRSLDGVRKDHIFSLTNSEGGIHALNYQLSNSGKPFRGLVLTGFPGRPVGRVARQQVERVIGEIEGKNAVLERYDEAVSASFSGKMPDDYDKFPDTIKALIMSLNAPANLPFSKELWYLDPIELLSQMEIPVLVIIGRNDVQVDWKTDGELVSSLASRKNNITFMAPENTDHVLKFQDIPRDKQDPTKSGMGYNSENRKLNDRTVDLVLSWLRKNA